MGESQTYTDHAKILNIYLTQNSISFLLPLYSRNPFLITDTFLLAQPIGKQDEPVRYEIKGVWETGKHIAIIRLLQWFLNSEP